MNNFMSHNCKLINTEMVPLSFQFNALSTKQCNFIYLKDIYLHIHEANVTEHGSITSAAWCSNKCLVKNEVQNC